MQVKLKHVGGTVQSFMVLSLDDVISDAEARQKSNCPDQS